jgi:hypothetical protein
MGFFNRLFGSDLEYPLLDEGDPATRQVEALRSEIETIADRVQVPIEVIPSEGEAFIFAGEPPRAFGVFMVDRGHIGNLKELAEHKGLSEDDLLRVTDDLRSAYVHSQKDQRFTAETSKGRVTVTPSPGLLSVVRKIIKEDMSK